MNRPIPDRGEKWASLWKAICTWWEQCRLPPLIILGPISSSSAQELTELKKMHEALALKSVIQFTYDRGSGSRKMDWDSIRRAASLSSSFWVIKPQKNVSGRLSAFINQFSAPKCARNSEPIEDWARHSFPNSKGVGLPEKYDDYS